jgi:hypothetical protein
MTKLLEYISTSKKFLAGGRDCGYNGDSMSTQSVASCKAKLQSMCAPPSSPSSPSSQSSPAVQQGQWYVVNYDYIMPPDYGVKAANAKLDVAYFLLTRAPFAWVAGGPMLGWHMSHWWTANKTRRIDYHLDLRPDEFNADYGVPIDNCTQTTQEGVFTRTWSRATVTVDCNALQGYIEMRED